MVKRRERNNAFKDQKYVIISSDLGNSTGSPMNR